MTAHALSSNEHSVNGELTDCVTEHRFLSSDERLKLELAGRMS